MKVLMLTFTHADRVADWEAMSPEEQAAFRDEHNVWFANHGARVTGGTELAYPQQASSVTLDNGAAVVSDGPFAETKELLGGIIELDVDSFEHAEQIAAEWPNLQGKGNRVVLAKAGEVGVPD